MNSLDLSEENSGWDALASIGVNAEDIKLIKSEFSPKL